MYVAKVPNRKSPPAYLLRESYREGGKVKSRTLANLTKLPLPTIEVIRRALKGENLVSPSDAFQIQSSVCHGHVQAIHETMKQLNFASLIASRPSHQRNLVQALVASRILNASSKLSTQRWWHNTSLPETFNVADANEDDLYDCMDWLLKNQANIEKKLAKRHLKEGALAMFDLTHPDYPNERLIACRNSDLRTKRRAKRELLLNATVKELEKIQKKVNKDRLYLQNTESENSIKRPSLKMDWTMSWMKLHCSSKLKDTEKVILN